MNRKREDMTQKDKRGERKQKRKRNKEKKKCQRHHNSNDDILDTIKRS